jgi:hypothetical protein
VGEEALREVWLGVSVGEGVGGEEARGQGGDECDPHDVFLRNGILKRLVTLA